MSEDKVLQFSTIGALMSGLHDGEFAVRTELLNLNYNFGLGCSDKVNAEVTILDGHAHLGTAKEETLEMPMDNLSPFIQITNFDFSSTATSIAKDGRRALCLKVTDAELTDKNFLDFMVGNIHSENFFVALTINAEFSEITIRRPQRIGKEETRTMIELAAAQQVDTYTTRRGTIVGMFTPDIFGRLSVPGFHFHFLTEDRKECGHVLSFKIYKGVEATVRLEEKHRFEVILPEGEAYRQLPVDLGSLDGVIHKVEK